MSWFQKEAPNEITARAHKRVERLTSGEILQWADTAGAGVARALSDHAKHADSDSIEDAYSGLLTMLGVVEVLRNRALR